MSAKGPVIPERSAELHGHFLIVRGRSASRSRAAKPSHPSNLYPWSGRVDPAHNPISNLREERRGGGRSAKRRPRPQGPGIAFDKAFVEAQLVTS